MESLIEYNLFSNLSISWCNWLELKCELIYFGKQLHIEIQILHLFGYIERYIHRIEGEIQICITYVNLVFSDKIGVLYGSLY